MSARVRPTSRRHLRRARRAEHRAYVEWKAEPTTERWQAYGFAHLSRVRAEAQSVAGRPR